MQQVETRFRYLLSAALLSGLAACSGSQDAAPPPRSTDIAPTDSQTSLISVPIITDQSTLNRLIESQIPETLWTINQHSDRCVPPQKLKLFGAKIDVTPAISCTIVGDVKRGPIYIHGDGKNIIADIPLQATIKAQDIAGILKGETATGSALARAYIQLNMNSDWTPTGTVTLKYDWTTSPGIDFLGQRITFTDQADEKLQPIIKGLEARLPNELAKLDIRSRAANLWKQSFTSILLNAKNPPVWMRITPRSLIYNGYSLTNGKLQLNMGLDAITETFVGNRPASPPVKALPSLSKAATNGKLNFYSPVLGAYAELEPIVLQALTKRSARPFDVPALGKVSAEFHDIEIYGTDNGRIAVGLNLTAWETSSSKHKSGKSGKLWLTAIPVNKAGSAELEFHDLTVAGSMNATASDLLIKLGNAPAISELIASALTQNLTHDLEDLVTKIRAATRNLKEDNFIISINIEGYEIGSIKAYGNGVQLPARITGTAKINYDPN